MSKWVYFHLLLCFILIVPVEAQTFDYSYEQVFNEDRISFSRPVDLVFYNDNSEALILEKGGKIYHIENKANIANKNLVLDISYKVKDSNEEGLLGIALDPNFMTNGYYYVQYSELNPNYYSDTRVSRFTFNLFTQRTDPSTEIILISEPQFYPSHKGGRLTFDNNDYLYFALGDGGKDPWQAQNLSNFKGAMMRIDVSSVDTTGSYTIPSDNPFTNNNQSIMEEIYAYGFRNPWRFSIDQDFGTIWLGDVGQASFEEINIVQSGANYGWPYAEALDCYNTTENPVNCGADSTLINPVFSYPHSSTLGEAEMYGAAVVGGYVYRGTTHNDLVGKYIFSDFLGGVWSLEDIDGTYKLSQIAQVSAGINTLAVDQNNEIIITTRAYGANIFYLSGGSSIAVQPSFMSSTLVIIIALLILMGSWIIYWKKESIRILTTGQNFVDKWVNSMSLIFVSGFLFRVSQSPIYSSYINLAPNAFDVSSKLAPIPFLYYQMLNLTMEVSRGFTSLLISIINISIVVSIVYMIMHIVRTLNWEQSKIDKFGMILATALSIDPNMIVFSKMGHIAPFVTWIITGLLYFSILQVREGSKELKVTTFVILILLTNFYMILGILLPLFLIVNISKSFNRSMLMQSLGLGFVLILFNLGLNVFGFNFDIVVSLRSNLLPREMYIIPPLDYIWMFANLSIYSLPFIFAVFVSHPFMKKSISVFLLFSTLCFVLTTNYMDLLLIFLNLVMITTIIIVIMNDKSGKVAVGIGLFLYSMIMLNSGVNLVAIAEYFRYALVVKLILITLPITWYSQKMYQSRGIGSMTGKISVIILLFLMITPQFTMVTPQPEIIDDKELIDIGAYIKQRYPELTIFVPDGGIQLQIKVILPTSDTYVTDDVQLILHFKERREDLALILVTLDQIDKEGTSLIPLDYYKNYPLITEITQAGAFTLYLIDNTA